jgi:hypothetical protein
MTHKEYNGWTNYETWLVKLWMDNEEGTHLYFREQAEQVWKDDPDKYVIDHEKYGQQDEFNSLAEAQEGLRDCGEGFEDTTLTERWLEGKGEILDECREVVGHIEQDNDRICTLAGIVQEYHEEALPKLEGFAADLMNAALSEVNWEEIAGSLLDDAKEALEA